MIASKLRKQERLGMSLGKARNILVNKILFDLVCKANKNTCIKCNKEITTVQELSIEHVTPWLDSNDPSFLFFDLNNIAFSHLRCNRPHSNGAVRLRKIGPEGTQWCLKCKDFLSEVEFQKNKSRWNGYNHLYRRHQKIHDDLRRK